MKRLVVLCLLLVACITVSAQNTKGQSSIGANVGYAFEFNNASLGIDYRYSITDEFRIGPSITHLVKNDGIKAWMLDLNAHYLVRLSDMFAFYPLGGLSLSFWNESIHLGPWGKFDGDATRFGANIGLGGEVYATNEITIGLEFKYNIIKDFDQAMFAVRVGYNF